MKKILTVISMTLMTLFCSVTAFGAEIDDSKMWEYEVYENGKITVTSEQEAILYIATYVEDGRFLSAATHKIFQSEYQTLMVLRKIKEPSSGTKT